MPDPQKIGKYTIIERIGRGGMGYVFKAHDPILKRDVAIKTMVKDVAEDPELRSRFTREAQSAGGLRHPNIVTIYDLGEDENGCPFIAMEFLTGTDIEHIIKNKKELSLLKKLDIIIQTCAGLGYAHANGIVHRDIKAPNIRVLDNGEAKIMDFGIAKMTASHFTRTGMVMGTPHYMAPEQIRGEKVDGRADIFSVGVMLYELLTYRKPFPGDNPTTVLFKIIHEDPDPLVDESFSPPQGLDDVVFRALKKKPEERYQTCEEMAEDLRFIYGMIQQESGSDAGMGPTAISYPTNRITGTPPGSRTPYPGSHPRMTLPSQQRLAAAQGVSGMTGTPPRTAAAKTRLSTPTQATAQMPPEPAQPDQGATVWQADAVPPQPAYRTAAPAQAQASAKWLISASIAAVAGILIVIFAAVMLFRKPEVKSIPTAQPIEKQHPPVEAAVGWLALNVQPWAEIAGMKDDKGRFINPPSTMTPCRMELEPGTYEITLTSKQFKPMVVKVEVKRNETTLIHRTLEGFDHEKAVESLGL
jgi:serine/threonine-protein kinase